MKYSYNNCFNALSANSDIYGLESSLWIISFLCMPDNFQINARHFEFYVGGTECFCILVNMLEFCSETQFHYLDIV